MDFLVFCFIALAGIVFLVFSNKTKDLLLGILAVCFFILCASVLYADPVTLSTAYSGYSYVNGTTCTNKLTNVSAVNESTCSFGIKTVDSQIVKTNAFTDSQIFALLMLLVLLSLYVFFVIIAQVWK